MYPMDEDFVVRLIESWNTDPLLAPVLRGRRLEVQRGPESISVSWRDAGLKIFVLNLNEAAAVGWGDQLTDLIEILGRPPAN